MGDLLVAQAVAPMNVVLGQRDVILPQDTKPASAITIATHATNGGR